VGYPPSHPNTKFPAAVEDAIAATKWVAGHASSLGIDATRLVIGGDSRRSDARRGGFARTRSQKMPGPAILLQCLIYARYFDFGGTSSSRRGVLPKIICSNKVTLDADLADYLPERSRPRRSQKFHRFGPWIWPDCQAAIIHNRRISTRWRDEGHALPREKTDGGRPRLSSITSVTTA